MPLIPRVGAAAHTPPRRRINLAMSITARECDPMPISRSPSVARTRNSIRRPSILVTSASPATMLPTTVGARWRTSRSLDRARLGLALIQNGRRHECRWRVIAAETLWRDAQVAILFGKVPRKAAFEALLKSGHVVLDA